ncbi:MAG: extracellular solute-binding protein [Dongiaceae bacterium]
MILSRRSLLQGSLALLPGSALAWLPRSVPAQSAGSKIVHALAMHGEPKYGAGFQHFDFVNPQAPIGGQVKQSAIGTFDSFNPFIIQGNPAAGIGYLLETLTAGSGDEPFTEYGFLAESIELADDRSWVVYAIRPEAKWHDGNPITPDDVVFSFDILRAKGDPFYRIYYSSVLKAEKIGDRTVRFTFDGKPNRELPLIMGQLTIIPKHYWEGRDFTKPGLDVPIGSGPFKIESFEAGRWISYKRVPDYWGWKLPQNIGLNNWETIRYEYYRDPLVAFEAFKAGEYDFRGESSAKNWALGYDIPQFQDGRIVKELIPDDSTQGMQSYAFNIRREIFGDRRVRQALAYAFDFEWTNKTLFYGLYHRTKSYWAGGELASRGLPQGEELEILERYRGRVPDEVLTAEYQPPSTDGSGNNRANLRTATGLLKDIGWEVAAGALVNRETGKTMAFEILLADPLFERISQPLTQNFERLGIKVTIRTVDPSQYQNRVRDFDYDMIVTTFGQSESPGNEQREFWGSANADVAGTRNYIGIKDPVIDELIELVIAAESRESLISRTHALDRVLLWGHYVIPQWNLPADRVAYWNKFSRPDRKPKYGVGFNSWWIDAEKVAALAANGAN